MTVGLDTSVVIRLLTGEPSEQARAALSFVRDRFEAGEKVVIGDWVLAEAYHALQHHYAVPKIEVFRALHDLVTTAGFEVEPYVVPILATRGLATVKPGFVDRLIHGGYSARGSRVVTFEKAAARLKGSIVLQT